jgi:hypothetical protein
MIYADGPEDRTVFVLGRLCMEDFFEIIQLAGNGYGFGALKLVRSLYERAVTMAFLSGQPLRGGYVPRLPCCGPVQTDAGCEAELWLLDSVSGSDGAD